MCCQWKKQQVLLVLQMKGHKIWPGFLEFGVLNSSTTGYDVNTWSSSINRSSARLKLCTDRETSPDTCIHHPCSIFTEYNNLHACCQRCCVSKLNSVYRLLFILFLRWTWKRPLVLVQRLLLLYPLRGTDWAMFSIWSGIQGHKQHSLMSCRRILGRCCRVATTFEKSSGNIACGDVANDYGSVCTCPKSVVFNLGYAYPRGYAKTS
jgi:hypothetical protein